MREFIIQIGSWYFIPYLKKKRYLVLKELLFYSQRENGAHLIKGKVYQ